MYQNNTPMQRISASPFAQSHSIDYVSHPNDFDDMSDDDDDIRAFRVVIKQQPQNMQMVRV
jgi:hypothetical protein